MGKTSVKLIEESKFVSVSLKSEWFQRLIELTNKDRQSSAAAQVRLMIMMREDQLKINPEQDK